MNLILRKMIVAALLLARMGAKAQTYAPLKTDWQRAGYAGMGLGFSHIANIVDFGADTTGATSSNGAFNNAIQSLNGAAGVIYFPAGKYFFDASIVIHQDSIVLRGAAYSSTSIKFDLSGRMENLIQISGTVTSDTSVLTASAARGTYTITVANAASFHPQDWVSLGMDDASFMTSAWAYGSLTQLMQIHSISGNVITFASPFRFNYELGRRPMITKVYPRSSIGIECLRIQRMDATTGQSSNIAFEHAVNCKVNGIESDSANFAHVEVNRSSNIEVTNSYFHDAFAYGGNGQGYGVLLQFGTNECLISANYFDHLRHSMILQAGANGNVLSYNYSLHPYWTEPSLPDSSSGDLVMHGNYPFMNLAEGNFVRNIVIDDSHGKNGPYNTFFRNRASGFGVFMNFNPATDSVQLIGNEITNDLIGLSFIQGNGHFIWGNNYRGTITSGNATIPDTSLYLPAGQKPPCAGSYSAWPVVGRPGRFNTGTIYAAARVANGQLAACACGQIASTTIPSLRAAEKWSVYPNPAVDYFMINDPGKVDRVEVFDTKGSRVLSLQALAGKRIDIAALMPGAYYVRITEGNKVVVKRFIKN